MQKPNILNSFSRWSKQIYLNFGFFIFEVLKNGISWNKASFVANLCPTYLFSIHIAETRDNKQTKRPTGASFNIVYDIAKSLYNHYI